jgi:hypothetical protein
MAIQGAARTNQCGAHACKRGAIRRAYAYDRILITGSTAPWGSYRYDYGEHSEQA